MNIEMTTLEDDYLTMMEDMGVEAMANGMVNAINSTRLSIVGQARVDMIDALKDIIFEFPVEWTMFYTDANPFDAGRLLMVTALARPSHDALSQAVCNIVWEAASNE